MPTTHTSSVPRTITVAAWSVPVLILGQFALLAVVPVVMIVVSVFRHARLRVLRPYAAALAVLYAVPLGVWALSPDRAESLSKDIDPWLAALVVAAAVTLAVRAHLLNRRPAG